MLTRTILLTAALLGCSSKADAPAQTKPAGADTGAQIEAVLTQYAALKTEMCACKSKACGDDVQAQATAALEMAGKVLKDAKVTKEQDDRFNAVQGEMQKCQSAIGGW